MGWPHPIRWIGNLIGGLTNSFLNIADRDLDCQAAGQKKRRFGLLLVVIVVLITGVVSFLLLIVAYKLNSVAGVVLEAIMTYYCLAAKSLYVESMKVASALSNEGIVEGKKAVSMIVGRDTNDLDETGVIKAAVETVAENTSDGVIAPMLYLAIGGPVLGFIYKAINTMDSMVGYKNDKYMDFGRCAAKLDDIVNFIPSRISAWLMILACVFLGKDYSSCNALRIYRRDRFNHSSPNSAQTESACAGALGLRLAGPASYFGQIVPKKYIGDSLRAIEIEDIKRANKLMIVTELLCVIICMILLYIGLICINLANI